MTAAQREETTRKTTATTGLVAGQEASPRRRKRSFVMRARWRGRSRRRSRDPSRGGDSVRDEEKVVAGLGREKQNLLPKFLILIVASHIHHSLVVFVVCFSVFCFFVL